MADPVRETPAAPSGRDRLMQIAFALDAQAEIAARPGQMMALQNLAAEVREIAAGYAVVRLPEAQATGADSMGARWFHSGRAAGVVRRSGPDTAGLPGVSGDLAAAREGALDLLAVCDAMERATSPAEPEGTTHA